MYVVGHPLRAIGDLLHHRYELLQDLITSTFYFNELRNHVGVVGKVAQCIFEFGICVGQVLEFGFELFELRLLAHGQGFPAKNFHDIAFRSFCRQSDMSC
jgi:hypothetical protein